MRNYVQPGDILAVAAPTGGVTSGDPVLIGGLFGVACSDREAGGSVEIAVAGVFALPKVTGAITAGALLHFDPVEKKITTTAGGNPIVGFATEDAASGAATVNVRLLGLAVPTAAA